jgi:hypothetical protein
LREEKIKKKAAKEKRKHEEKMHVLSVQRDKNNIIHRDKYK